MNDGTGMPFTDAVIGNDGARYLLTGGRRTESALWRVSNTGGDPPAPVAYQSKGLALMDAASAKTSLGSDDRVMRFNSRAAHWSNRAHDGRFHETHADLKLMPSKAMVTIYKQHSHQSW